MAESPPKKESEAALAGRIGQLEEKLKLIEVLRKKQRNFSLVGVLLLLSLLLLFVFRLYSHVNTTYVEPLNDETRRAAFLQELARQTNAEKIVKQEVETFVKQLSEEVVPELMKQLTHEFTAARPEIEKAACDMGERLNKYILTDVQEQLAESLIQALEDLEQEIKTVLPEFSVEELQKHMDEAKALFIEKLTDLIEERIARVSASMESLKSTVTQRAKTGEDAPYSLEAAQTELLEALVDLLVYELKPELGEEMAE